MSSCPYPRHGRRGVPLSADQVGFAHVPGRGVVLVKIPELFSRRVLGGSNGVSIISVDEGLSEKGRGGFRVACN